MLLRNLIKQLILYFSFLLPLPTFAVVDTQLPYATTDLSISGPADAMEYAKDIKNWGGRSPQVICASKQATYNLARIDFTPLLPYTGKTYQATSAHNIDYLFDFGFSGLAMIPMYVTNLMNQGDMPNSSTAMRSIKPNVQTIWTGSISNANRPTSSLTWGYGLILYKDALRIPAGTHIIPPQPLYRLSCIDFDGVVQETVTIVTTGFTINSVTTACTPKETNAVIQMDGIPLPTMESATIGTLIGTKYRSFSLTCEPNINVFISVNDLANPSNTGGVVSTLTADSTATGVGYVVTTSDRPAGLTLSAPGSTPGTPSRSQYYIGTAGATGTGVPDINLGFSYTKTSNTVTEGTAKAMVGITYSYQ